MKNGILAMLFCLISLNHTAICQSVKETKEECAISHRDYTYFSPQESWEINREAYQKQLVSEGLNAKEVEVKLGMFDEIKVVLVGQVNLKIKEASLLNDHSEMLMRQAEIRIMDAQIFKKKIELLKLDSGSSTKEINQLQAKADELMEQAKQSLAESKALKKKSDSLMDTADRQKKTGSVFMNNWEIFFQEVILLSPERSKKRTIEVNVDKRKSVVFRVVGSIEAGSCLIEIFDPNNKKEGEVLLNYTDKKATGGNKKSDACDKKASGGFTKTIDHPKAGTWHIKVTPKDSKGWVNIKLEEKRD